MVARASRCDAFACALVLMLLAAGCARHSTARLPSPPARIGSTETGLASWYGVPYDGRPTASGEIFDMQKLTAAHRALPFQTWVEITNLSNGKQVDVRITDRGPFVRGRIVDLSMAAARQIDMLRAGTARVRLKVIDPPVTAAPPVNAPVATVNTPAVKVAPVNALETTPDCRQVCRSSGRLLRSVARGSLARSPSLSPTREWSSHMENDRETRPSGECWSDTPSPFKQLPL